MGEDIEKEAIQIAAELKRDPENDSEKVSLFRKIQKSRYRAAINRRYYSYYRVIQAAIEAFAGKQINISLKFIYSEHTCKNLIPMVVTRAMANSSKNHALLMCRI